MGVKQLEFQMRQLFENGEASPFEIVGEFGETLMHVSVITLIFSIGCLICQQAAYFALFPHSQLSNKAFHQRLGVLKTLHHFGVPLDEQNLDGRYLARNPFFQIILTDDV